MLKSIVENSRCVKSNAIKFEISSLIFIAIELLISAVLVPVNIAISPSYIILRSIKSESNLRIWY